MQRSGPSADGQLQKALVLQLKSLQGRPVEGFRITLVDESDLYNPELESGYFKAYIQFPIDYLYSPPTFRFLAKMWPPNIYENGDVHIPIPHLPVDDPQSGELPLKECAEIIRKQVSASKAEAEKDGEKVPTTLAEYCIKAKVLSNDSSSDFLYDNDIDYDDIDDEDEEEGDADSYDNDHGNKES
uniref:UBC core domain-containing protein n=1 Tax=Oryctolagus cuniculus TaxID=9986 RepID=G1SHT8_RABIT